MMRFSAAARVLAGGSPSSYPCDDRARVVDGGRLCVVADGSGPRYGGYHDPIALDPGLDALAAALAPDRHEGHACDEACMRDAFLYANETMCAIQEELNHAIEQERPADPDERLSASLRAARRVARDRFGRAIATHAHATGSVTALCLAGGRAIVGQVGLCRAYRWHGGAVELLLPDDGLARRLPGFEEMNYGISLQLLGYDRAVKVGTRAVACEPGDRFVLCSDGAWSVASEDGIDVACGYARAEEVVARVAAALKPMRDDAAIVAVVIESV